VTSPRIYRSPAKINWYLRVLARRSDGYHDIETVFHEISLADELRVEPADGRDCLVKGLPAGIDPCDNLITRAHALLRQECGSAVGGLRIIVTKHIPAAGGLGGGSSNAATTLKAINDLCGLGLSFAELETLGARLGSDVPFFIRGGCALGTGRGERLTALTARGDYHLALAIPPEPMPTAESYRALESTHRGQAAQPVEAVITALEAGDLTALAASIHNDFNILAERRPWYWTIERALTDARAQRVFLCGSGSTVAALLGPPLSLAKVQETLVKDKLTVVSAQARPTKTAR
jgi:4-diphosphocytidyl-2-C-methyl-D-erythritol kinase